MKLAIRARDVLGGLSPMLVNELDSLINRINLVWAVGHDPSTGTHKQLAFDASVETQTTVGAAGSADPLPATPTGYVPVTLPDGREVVLAYYEKE